MLKLRNILLSNRIYYIILIISLFITIFRFYLPIRSSLNNETKKVSASIYNLSYDGDRLTVILKVNNKEKIQGYYYFKTEEELKYFKDSLKLGDKLELYGDIRDIDDVRVSNTFNFKKYLKVKKIYKIITIKKIKIINHSINPIYLLKNLIIKYLNYYKSGSYIKMLLLGDTSYVSNDIINSFRENGISHLFAISGTQVTVLAEGIVKFLKKIKVREKNRYIIVNIFITIYMFLTGSPPAILRSVLFFILSSINKYNYFYVSNINIFILTLSITLLINPFYVYDLGFLYSYLISMTLIMCSNLLENKNFFKSLFFTSVISFLVSIPITMYNFYEINVMGIIYNLFYVPFVNNILFPVAIISIFFYPADYLLCWCIKILESSSLFLSRISFGKIIFPKLNIIYYIFYLVILYGIYKFKKKILYLIFLFFLFFHYNFYYFFDSNYIYMFDVGQGDSILIHSKKQNMLIDTGGKSSYSSDDWKRRDSNSSIAINSTIPFLKSMGIRKLDYLELSHGDFDHLGESVTILDNFKVDKVFINEGYINYNERKIISKKDYSILYEGSSFSVGDFNFISINTDLKDENDSSSILYGVCGIIKIIFMGDASKKSEKYILDNYDIGKIDILKVGHHGSNTSSSKEFINSINPSYSLISVGKNNKFGHPNKETLENLSNSKIYRTDEDGSIMFKIKNNKLQIETCTP